MAERSPVRRLLLGALVVIILLVVAAVVLVRRALDPDELRPMAERQLSALLHVPVRVGQLELHVWPSPSLDGRDIDIGGEAAHSPPSLTLASLHLAPEIRSLFSPAIVIDRIELRGLRLNVLREADGRWALPGPTRITSGAYAPSALSPRPAPGARLVEGAAPAAQAEASPAVIVRGFTLDDATLAVFDEGSSAPAATVDRIGAVLHGEPRSLALEKITGAVGGSTLSGAGTFGRGGATFSFAWENLRPEDMPRLFALLGTPAPAGLAIDGRRPLTLDLKSQKGVLSIGGRLVAERIVLPPLTVTGFSSPFASTQDETVFSPIAFTAYKGAFTGRMAASPSATPFTWRIHGTLEHLDLGAMLAATTSLGQKLRGTGRLRLDVDGRGDLPVTRGTRGTIGTAVTNGVIRDFPLLATINHALEITEGAGKDTTFERLEGTFALGGGTAATKDLRLATGALTVDVAGTLGLDSQSLDFKGTARFSREKTAELRTRSKHVGGATNAQGQLEIPLTIRGTLSNPDFGIDMGQMLATAAKKELKRGVERELRKLFRP